jgi:hypothetical protein
VEDRHLITVDELRAAGALDVPPGWRKSLQVERGGSRSLFGEDDAGSDGEQPSRSDEQADESADEV